MIPPLMMLSLRWIPPAFVILGGAPLFLAEWAVIKVLTLPFPYPYYRRLDEYHYGFYQGMVGFFYEILSGVEVCVLWGYRILVIQARL